MIVVLGLPALVRGPGDAVESAGLAAGIARAAAVAGADVELVGRVGDDPDGEVLVLLLARAGIGHRALLRDARPTPTVTITSPDDTGLPIDVLAAAPFDSADASVPGPYPAGDADDGATDGPAAPRRLDAADIAMSLRYVPESRVLVVATRLDAAGAVAVADAAAFAGAAVIVVTPPGTAVPEALPGALVLEAPAADPDGAFAAVVARCAVAIDGGSAPATALRAAIASGGWERSEDDRAR